VNKANAIQNGRLSRRKAFKAKSIQGEKDFLALLINIVGAQRAGT